MSLPEIEMDVSSGLVGLLGALAVFKWTRRKSEGAILLDFHPVLGFLALIAVLVTRTILINLLA